MGLVKNIEQKFTIFMEQFPNNAESWDKATDDIKSFCAMVREEYNKHVVKAEPGDEAYIKPLDFYSFTKPWLWNTNAKSRIVKLWPKLSPQSKTKVLNCHI